MFPATHWLSRPFYTPKSVWPLSQSTLVQRWRRDSSSREGGRGLPLKPQTPPPDQWWVLCGAKASREAHAPPKHPRDISAQVADGPPPSNSAHPATAPTRPRRQQPRIPAPTPELTTTQKWWAAFLGDRASPEPGPWGRTQPRPATPAPKPRLTSDIALSLTENIGTRKMTRDTDESEIYITLLAQPAAERRWSKRRTTPTPPAGLLVIAMCCLLCNDI